jgi:hypothetical protein
LQRKAECPSSVCNGVAITGHAVERVVCSKDEDKKYLSPRRQDAKEEKRGSIKDQKKEFRLFLFRPWRLGVLARDILLLFAADTARS